jgi:methylglutaconyl-CoA hydratase
MTSILESIDNNPAVKVVVLKAAGDHFSAGADLQWMHRMAQFSFDENRNDALLLVKLMSTLNTLSKPTIALVHGAAFGGGVGLVACCDIAIAAESASFCLSEVKLGLIPAVISPYIVAAMGQRAARRYCLTGERFDAKEAHRTGLIHSVVGDNALYAAAMTQIEIILNNAPQAMSEAKSLIARVAHRAHEETLLFETAEIIARRRSSEEGKEGLSAFLEKRRPQWVKKNA